MRYISQFNPPAAPGAEPDWNTFLKSQEFALVGSLWRLWIQLAILSRSLIGSEASNLGDSQVIADRLTKLPEAFSGLLRQYFTPQQADAFQALLEEHITALMALIVAEINNDDRTVDQETRNLYANVDRLSAYLSSINEYWNQAEWQDLLNDYIEMLLAGLVAQIAKEYAREIDIFDDLQTQAIRIADYMAKGMIQRFRP